MGFENLQILNVKDLKIMCKNRNIKYYLLDKQELIDKIIFYDKWNTTIPLCNGCQEKKDNEKYQIEIKQQVKKEKMKKSKVFNDFLTNSTDLELNNLINFSFN